MRYCPLTPSPLLTLCWPNSALEFPWGGDIHLESWWRPSSLLQPTPRASPVAQAARRDWITAAVAPAWWWVVGGGWWVVGGVCALLPRGVLGCGTPKRCCARALLALWAPRSPSRKLNCSVWCCCIGLVIQVLQLVESCTIGDGFITPGPYLLCA